VAAGLSPERSVVTVLFDSAWKYVSVWDGDYSRRRPQGSGPYPEH
jgi:cysteine synthase